MESVAYSRLIPNSASTPAPPTAEHSAEMRLDVRLKNSRSRSGSDERFFCLHHQCRANNQRPGRWDGVGMSCNTPNKGEGGEGARVLFLFPPRRPARS